MKSMFASLLLLSLSAVAQQKTAVPDLTQLNQMISRYAPTELRVDTGALPAGDRTAMIRLIQAARIIDDIQLRQKWDGNPALYVKLSRDMSPLGKARAHYFWINKGPWSILDENAPFIPGVPPRPLGANFYPARLSKEVLEKWMSHLKPEQRTQAQGFFTVIERDQEEGASTTLKIVPYSEEYGPELKRAADLLREAAAATDNASLKKFLTLRADAFLSNDYFDSDVAWMDLDSPLDVTIGPYETYDDELFGYKAAFEAYINVRDQEESKKLAFFGQHLQSIENNLPIDQQYRNPKIGASSPIIVVNEVFGAGDGNQGVQTAAYNLPNDERVIQQKGSKRVMLKNVQHAKFEQILIPISKTVLAPAAQSDVDFNFFFTHILAHELTHGLGPHVITVAGRETNPRQELKELYSAVEEAKADVTGLFALQYLMDNHLLRDTLGEGEAAERKLYTTYLASSFRTLRFGVKDAHARGMAMQFNFLRDHGAYALQPDGTFSIDFSKIKQAVRDLDHELLMLEATGDYAKTQDTLATLSVIRPEVQAALQKLQSLPTDIEPLFVTADSVAPKSRPRATVSPKGTKGK
jgi:peptidase M49-like protein